MDRRRAYIYLAEIGSPDYPKTGYSCNIVIASTLEEVEAKVRELHPPSMFNVVNIMSITEVGRPIVEQICKEVIPSYKAEDLANQPQDMGEVG